MQTFDDVIPATVTEDHPARPRARRLPFAAAGFGFWLGITLTTGLFAIWLL